MSQDPTGGDKAAQSKTKGKDEKDQKKKMPRYSAERVIGSGSFGVVYKAMNIQTKQTVAIKKVREDRRYKVKCKCFFYFLLLIIIM